MFSSYPQTNVIDTSSTDNMIMSKTMDIAHLIYKYVSTHLPKDFPEKLTNHINDNFDKYIDSTSYKQTVLYKILQHAKILIFQTKFPKKSLQCTFTYLLDYFPYELFQNYTLFPVFAEVIEHSYFDTDLMVCDEELIQCSEAMYDTFDDLFVSVQGLNSSSTFNAIYVSFDN